MSAEVRLTQLCAVCEGQVAVSVANPVCVAPDIHITGHPPVAHARGPLTCRLHWIHRRSSQGFLVNGLISSGAGVYAAVYQVLKGERKNGQLISAILVAVIHASLS